MATIELDYGPFEAPLDGAGNTAALAAIQGDIELGKWPTVKEERQSELGQLVIDGVVELLAGSLVWLQRRGYKASDVAQRVKAFLHNAGDSERARAWKTGKLDRALEISDPRNEAQFLDKNKVLG